MKLMLMLIMSSSMNAAPLHQRIDQEINANAGGKVAPRAGDAELFRRLHLDLAGVIPTAEQARQFLNNKDPKKIPKEIDRLLSGKQFPRRIREYVSVWLLERRKGQAINDQEWNQFVESAFAKNQPWDGFVRELISAKTKAAIRFFEGGRSNHEQMTEDVARLLLGMNLECARCHNHPNVRDYKQAHFFGIYAYLKQTKLSRDKKKMPILIETAAKSKTEYQSVFAKVKRFIGPQLPDGMEISTPLENPRQLLARDLTATKNKRFARNSVNRFWFMMMGRGLVHPLDFDHSRNPPSHPKLLEILTDDFIAHKFDVRHLLREIALSQAYQRSGELPEGVKASSVKPESYRVAIAKGLSAEQMAWSLMRATGNLERISKQPAPKQSKFTHKDYINGRIPTPDNLIDVMTLFTATFGSPAGEAETEIAPSASQALFPMNEKLVLDWLKPRKGSLVSRLIAIKDPKELTRELYLATLSRLPEAEEVEMITNFLEQHKAKRDSAVGDAVWALLTSAEFRLNH